MARLDFWSAAVIGLAIAGCSQHSAREDATGGSPQHPAEDASSASAKRARSYGFDGSISRPVLEAYLSRAITMMDLCTGRGNVDDNIRMLKSTGVKFAGRTVYLWGSEHHLPAKLKRADEIEQKIHAVDPEIVLQACAFEIVTTNVEKISVPAWVFEEFDLPVQERNFDYEAMLFPNGRFVNHWSDGASVPDMTRPETKMWFYFLARSYIDVGMEAIHFGQVALIGAEDPDKRHWLDMMTRVRRYASRNARRHMIICDAHTPSGGPVIDGRLLFDFHSFPLRIKEVVERPQEGILEVGYLDSIFRRSRGGITPSGWKCDSLPYLVELDNFGRAKRPGEPGQSHWAWGYDEICWFARQPEEYRNKWLCYAWKWVRETDSNGFLQMPGSRCLADPPPGRSWYYANTQSEACPEGFNQEETIKAIWAEDK